MKLIAIGGEPATGKSTLMRKLIADMGAPKPFKFLKVAGNYYENHAVWLIGLGYGLVAFPGTDRLSMAVQPDFENFLRWLVPKQGTILFEGDRLFLKKNFELANELGLKPVFVFLLASKEVLKKRHQERKDTQKTVFLKGRETKYRRLSNDIPGGIFFKNESPEDLENNLTHLKRLAFS